VLDIQNLEHRWFKYKLKSYAPLIVVIALLVGLMLALLYIWRDAPSTEIIDKHPSIQGPSVDINRSEVSSAVQEAPMVIEPSMNFVQSFQGSGQLPPSTLPLNPVQPSRTPISTQPELPNPLPTAVTPSASKPLALNRNDTKLDIESVERRFKESPTPNLGLFIARYHYDHGNFSGAYDYALKTNTLNSNIDESWIIFSKALVKLGKTDQAKKTLTLYLSESQSESARALLNSIEKGSFK
jgi:hypothetical protein